MFNSFYDKDFNSVRKMNDVDNLVRPGDVRTGDNFYQDDIQPNFQGKKNVSNDSDSDDKDKDGFKAYEWFEVGNFDVDGLEAEDKPKPKD